MRAYTELVRHPGNRALFDAVEISILAQRLGWPLHLHAQGVRGTGKTTVLRAARSVLPWIRRIRGCLYNCDPLQPHCPEHRGLGRDEIQRLGSEWVPMPFLEISHSAKLGTVVGTIDLQRITAARDPLAVLLPGTLAKAHRGIVFVDEINRLADTAPELADVLLDVMGTRPGRLQIEEAGLPPVELEVSVAVWAASNPDEEPGPLEDVRRQLADRFDLTVTVGRPESAREVREILDRSAGRPAGGAVDGRRLREQRHALVRAALRPLPALPDDGRDLLAELYVRFQFESLRAVEAWQWAARLHALRAGRALVTRDDLLAVAPLVLQHRLDPRTLAEVLEALHEPERQRAGTPAGATATATPPGAGAPVPAAPGDTHAGREPEPARATGALGRLFGRVRGWWDAQPAAAGSLLPGAGRGGGSGGLDGQGGGGPGADGRAGRPGSGQPQHGGEVPAPPNPARPLLALRPEEVVQRLAGGDPSRGSPWPR